jgi:hypothetical protein
MTPQNFPLPTHIDKLVKIRNSVEFIIPVNPGSGPEQAPKSIFPKGLSSLWTPVFTGVTTFASSSVLAEGKIFFAGYHFFLDRGFLFF